MTNLKDIKKIQKASDRNGYEIVFNDQRKIWLTKKRTIAGLLLLIHYGIASEADLAGANNRLATIKKILINKMDSDLIQDRYGDANKPFSELWTEEGFSCVHSANMDGNRQYVLDQSDHEKLFQNNIKNQRVQISSNEKRIVLRRQNNRCNICGSLLKESKEIPVHAFSKDRVKLEFDHRIPIDRGGKNKVSNIQALCHYCNKCKRQMCFLCDKKRCSHHCALVHPENKRIVIATKEDIQDRITKLHK